MELAKNIENNPTLKYANENGMKLEFISRDDYRKKNQSGALEDVTLIDFQGNPNKNIAANPAHRDLIKRLAEFAKKSGAGLKP